MRYYYPASRAHHAYAMCIDHGLMFEKRNGFWTLEGLREIDPGSSYKIMVAEECEYLLAVRVGDLVTSPNVCGVVNQVGASMLFIRVPERHNGKTFYAEPIDLCKIIHRDGKPFAMPEYGD